MDGVGLGQSAFGGLWKHTFGALSKDLTGISHLPCVMQDTGGVIDV
jgi:hypothetical protein